MEDFGGSSLGHFANGRSLSLEQFLPIALQLIEILHLLHQQRVIHKDIKPANILIQPKTGQVKLIDFSISSLLPRETQEIKTLNGLEGTLAYLSPEQTGRMNRGVDYRSDFYSLGVTFYELLTGRLPFRSTDPTEIVHCHIAEQPLPVCDLNPEIPLILGEIVHKLMAKNAEDRYQSALGLKHDLVTCMTQWQATGNVSEFELGQRDLCDRFLIPEKLYGRESEVEALLEAFGRVAKGAGLYRNHYADVHCEHLTVVEGCDLYLILKRLKLFTGKAFKRFYSSSFDYSLTSFTGTQNPYGAKGGCFFLMYRMEVAPLTGLRMGGSFQHFFI
jgi:serine/threonine protein kinase